MYDSFFVKCPKCGKELEFQSKSGACILIEYGHYPKTKNLWSGLLDGGALPLDVAQGINGDVILCQFCNAHVKFEVLNKMPKARFKLRITKREYSYPGNYNPEHPDSIRRQKELKRILGGRR